MEVQSWLHERETVQEYSQWLDKEAADSFYSIFPVYKQKLIAIGEDDKQNTLRNERRAKYKSRFIDSRKKHDMIRKPCPYPHAAE